MRILILSNTPFLPPTAGNRARIRQMVEHLVSRGAEVAMLMLPDVDSASWDESGMRARLARFELVRPSMVRRASTRIVSELGRVVRSPDHDPTRPLGVDDWCPRWFRRRAEQVARDWRPDAVIVEYVFLSACLEDVRRAAPEALGIIDTHDVMHLRGAAYAAAGLAPRWFHTTPEEERRGLARADVVLAMQDAEADILRRMLPGAAVLVVPHGQPVHPAPAERAEPARLLLVASHNEINLIGLRWFLEEVWPALRVDVPAVELVVCGTIAEKVGGVPPGVVVCGPVESLSEQYAGARVVVNPVPSATGAQVKSAEALCHGRPVVATPAGAAGLEPGRGVLVAETARDFRAALVRLLVDEGLWGRVVAEGTAYARRQLSPEAAFAPLMERLAEAPRRRVRA